MSRIGTIGTNVGNASLKGWRGAAVDRVVARPVAKRTSISEEQVRAIVGLLLLAYTVYRLAKPLVRAARER
ncbi:MAG: hypothetical protein WD206_07325 [Actinomycetota bacterium]